jgi:hypothetical protein
MNVTASTQQHRIRWSKTEVELLEKLYPLFRLRELVDKFPQRNKGTIATKALSLNLPSARSWFAPENRILQEHFQDSSREVLQELLPKRSWPAIMAQGERLHLQRIRTKPRHAVDEDYFKTWSPSMAYVLGFILADGCIIHGTRDGYSDSLKFGVQLRDKNILEKIKSELKSEHALSVCKNAVHFCIASQKIVDDLKALGISYRKSLRETVPDIPERFIKDFIRGVIDGDGTVRIGKDRYPVLSVSGGEATITYLREHFFKKFGLYSKIIPCKYSNEIQRHLYSIAYGANSAKTLIDYLYRDAKLFLDRKYATALRCLEIPIIKHDHSNCRSKKYHETHTR